MNSQNIYIESMNRLKIDKVSHWGHIYVLILHHWISSFKTQNLEGNSSKCKIIFTVNQNIIGAPKTIPTKIYIIKV